MSQKPLLSVVVHTKNSAETLAETLQSVQSLAQEVLVMDMSSTDNTVKIARQFGARVLNHPDVGYVEPARNAALAAARGSWILVLDADEVITPGLADWIVQRLRDDTGVDAYFLPRRNRMFGKWVQSGWWPDHVLRFFRAGHVTWSDTIHSVPEVSGTAEFLPANPQRAILHNNYQTIDQFIDRAQRYGKILAAKKDLTEEDPLAAALSELLRRTYTWEGIHDGAHGRHLAFLQACAEGLARSYHWENAGFPLKISAKTPTIAQVLSQAARDARYWEAELRLREKLSPLEQVYWRIRRKLKI